MTFYGLLSFGLWQRKADISVLLDDAPRLAYTPMSTYFRPDVYVGWGGKTSGSNARKLGKKHGKKLLLLEDGFLCSYRPGKRECKHSYFHDSKAMHFERAKQSELTDTIHEDIFDADELERAKKCIAEIRSRALSKYNNYPDIDAKSKSELTAEPYVLLIEQVEGDASLPKNITTAELYKQMLVTASASYPNVKIMVRSHPARTVKSPLVLAASQIGIKVIDCPPCNIWDAINNTTAVFTISSHVGFEALMAGRKVHTFGTPFYAGWRLTTDHNTQVKNGEKSSLEKLFVAAYIRQSKYIDVHNGQRCEIETAIEQLSTIATARKLNRRRVHTVSFSPWRRKVTAPFLQGATGAAMHHSTLAAAEKKALSDGGVVAIWGAAKPAPKKAHYLRLEDGFIRSIGLGADLHRPYSICADPRHLYFDTRGESLLHAILNNANFDDNLLERANTLRDMLLRSRLTKYNYQHNSMKPDFVESSAGKLKILVPGQVVDDQSVIYGNSIAGDNYDLVEATRNRYPDAFITYKHHPDVAAKLRDGGPCPKSADLVTADGDILTWIEWADRIETISSLTGFEALLRNKKVGVYGTPFYAGWGLTNDYAGSTSNGVKRTLAELVAASLILYPIYIHPKSQLPCSPELIISYFENSKNMSSETQAVKSIRRKLALVLKKF